MIKPVVRARTVCKSRPIFTFKFATVIVHLNESFKRIPGKYEKLAKCLLKLNF